jgi:uncharacterized protein with FMN-binding domain
VRRALPAAVITLVGLGALASFKSSPGIATKPLSSAIIRNRAAPPSTTSPTNTSPTTVSPDTSVPSSETTPTAAAPTTTTAGLRTVDGDPAFNEYGTVQVRVTLDGNTITGITALQMPYEHTRSAYISQQAEPYLQQEALQAQSAQIDVVSGATYTSQSYAQSLQSALDRAGG